MLPNTFSRSPFFQVPLLVATVLRNPDGPRQIHRFWNPYFLLTDTLRIGPPRGGHDRRDLASAEGILFDPKFNTVLMRSPNVFGIFSLQILRFLAEIYDFEQFSWAPVQDFSKNTSLLERYLRIFFDFSVFFTF